MLRLTFSLQMFSPQFFKTSLANVSYYFAFDGTNTLTTIMKYRSWLDQRRWFPPPYDILSHLSSVLHDAWDSCVDAEVLLESPYAMAGVHIAEALRKSPPLYVALAY